MESEESCGSGDGQKKGGSGEEKWRAERERQERETEELEEKFRMFDTDGDGRITSAELGTALRGCGLNPTQAEIADMIRLVDRDKNGTIDFDEFREMVNDGHKDSKEDIQRAFQVFDVDGNGYITQQELRDIMLGKGEPLSEEEVDDMLRHADSNGDGKINYEEFCNLWTSV